MKNIFNEKIEKISKDIFERYKKELSEVVETSYGIYALYDEDELYYVGKASDLKTRIKQHLKDKHKAQWSYFSLFLTKKSVLNDLESIIIAISNPKGNKAKPKGNKVGQLKNKLKDVVKKRQKEELNKLLGIKKHKSKKIRTKNNVPRPNLKKMFSKSKPLYKEYKGKEYKATLLTSGEIKYKNKLYKSPTSAAMAIVDSGTVNGWDFWYIQDENNDWIQLSSLT